MSLQHTVHVASQESGLCTVDLRFCHNDSLIGWSNIHQDMSLVFMVLENSLLHVANIFIPWLRITSACCLHKCGETTHVQTFKSHTQMYLGKLPVVHWTLECRRFNFKRWVSAADCNSITHVSLPTQCVLYGRQFNVSECDKVWHEEVILRLKCQQINLLNPSPSRAHLSQLRSLHLRAFSQSLLFGMLTWFAFQSSILNYLFQPECVRLQDLHAGAG